jgi:uncharacterized membrane protein
MRGFWDRVRHAVCYEAIGLALVVPGGAWAFDLHLAAIGVVGFVSTAIAMLWNYVYNLAFDHALRWQGRSQHKTVALRIVHAVTFELGMLALLAPFIMWYLGVDLKQALVMDVAFSALYMLHALVFNWGYDLVFPIPEPRA